jgi:hypothetical protein
MEGWSFVDSLRTPLLVFRWREKHTGGTPVPLLVLHRLQDPHPYRFVLVIRDAK